MNSPVWHRVPVHPEGHSHWYGAMQCPPFRHGKMQIAAIKTGSTSTCLENKQRKTMNWKTKIQVCVLLDFKVNLNSFQRSFSSDIHHCWSTSGGRAGRCRQSFVTIFCGAVVVAIKVYITIYYYNHGWMAVTHAVMVLSCSHNHESFDERLVAPPTQVLLLKYISIWNTVL